MRGNTFFGRVSIFALASALMVTPALGVIPEFNTGSGLTSGWQQLSFAQNHSWFMPTNPTTQASTFYWGGTGFNTTTPGGIATKTWDIAGTPDMTGTGHTWDSHLGYDNKYMGNPFDAGQSAWVGSYPYWKGGWSIFYYDFVVSNELGATANGFFSSDNSSYLFLDGFEKMGLGSDSGSFKIGEDASPEDLNANLLKYHEAIPAGEGNQVSYLHKSDFSFFAGQGTHRIWALVRNDAINDPSGNPLGFRLQFNPSGGDGPLTPVPEPFTMALGAAGIGLALRRRMKKTK